MIIYECIKISRLFKRSTAKTMVITYVAYFCLKLWSLWHILYMTFCVVAYSFRWKLAFILFQN